MIEIIKIISIFPIFFLFVIFPVNTFDKNDIILNYDLYSLNLIINLNIFLIFSLLPLAIENYQNIFLITYLVLFIYKIYNKSFKNIFYNKPAFYIFLLLFIIISLSVASRLELGWDAKYFYYIKTLFFYEGLNIAEIKNFKDYSWHPHLGSYIWAFFWKLPFIDYEYFGRLFYVFIFCFSIIGVIFKNKDKSYLKTIFILSILILIYSYERFSGLQEVLIFSLLIISSRFLYDLKENKNLKNILALLLVSNLLIWIKSEGLVFSMILMIIMFFSHKINLQKKIIVVATGVIIFSFKKIIYMYLQFETIAQPHYNLAFLLSLDFLEVLNRIGYTFFYLSYYSLINVLFFIGIIILLFINLKKTKELDITIFNYYFLLNISFIFAAYIFREMEIVYSLRTTLERIVFVSSGFYLYLIFLFLDKRVKF